MRDYGWHSTGYSAIGSRIPKMVKVLLLTNIGVFLLQVASGQRLEPYFGLSSIRVINQLYLWQFVTYMFLHGGVWHLAINMFMLWMFGRELESIWGEKAFLRYYLTCGIGGGICTFLFTMGNPIITIGASGAIFGVLVAYAVIFPDRLITLLLFFVLPVTLKAKHLVMIFAGLELLYCISGTPDGVGHFAHLGGAVVGYIYLQAWRKRTLYGTAHGETLLSRLRESLRNWKRRQHDGLDNEVDRILDKISKSGLESLSRRERNILQKKSMRK